MKAISLHLDEEVLEETTKLTSLTKKSRNRYINDALSFYNDYLRKRLLKEQFKEDSAYVRQFKDDTYELMDQLDD